MSIKAGKLIKMTSLAFFVAVIFFAFPGKVFASLNSEYDQMSKITVECPADADNFKYAVYAIRDGSPVTGGAISEFLNKKQICVKVLASDTQLTFTQLLQRQAGSEISLDWGDAQITKNRVTVLNGDAEDGCYFFESGTGELVNVKAKDAKFDVEVPKVLCNGASRSFYAPSEAYLLRFGSIGSPQYKYLYPLGFKNQETLIADCAVLDMEQCKIAPNCFWQRKIMRGGVAEDFGQCKSKVDRSLCVTLPQDWCGTTDGSPACAWNATTNRCITALEEGLAGQNRLPGDGNGGIFKGAIPACAFEGTCNSINDVLKVVINYGTGAFAILGTFAFAFFVYGGFTIIISMGNAERVKKGTNIIVAAIIGIVICFSAYALINFILNALQVSSEFRII